MNRKILRTIAVVSAVLFMAAMSEAALKVVGKDATASFDTSGFPAARQEGMKLMVEKCNNTKCHTMQYAVDAIKNGIAPITKSPFDKAAARAYGLKMMRRPDSGIDKNQAKIIVDTIFFLLEENAK